MNKKAMDRKEGRKKEKVSTLVLNGLGAAFFVA